MPTLPNIFETDDIVQITLDAAAQMCGSDERKKRFISERSKSVR
jgi:hypothetical protein